MLFFSHLKRVKARRLQIAELDKEITRLYNRKSELDLNIQKKELELESFVREKEDTIKYLEEKSGKISSFITIDEQIDNANLTLASINTEISEAKDELEKLKKLLSILQECVDYDKLREKYKNDLKDAIDKTLKKLLDTYPNIQPAKLNILDCFTGFYDKKINFTDIELTVNTNLTKFAIEHRIDVNLYKDLMYNFNAPWVKRFNELKSKYEKLNVEAYENEQLFNGFIVLVDNN